jgi:hypothetical protein
MSGLSLMQTRSFIDRLGDLDEEITKVCRAADVMAKGVGKDHASGVDRLKEACDALQDKQKYVREAKDCLLGLDGFMHALSGEMRDLMEHPTLGSAVGRISQRMQHPLAAHVTTIVEETLDGLRRVAAAVKALREAKEDAKRAGSIKESTKALAKVCSAAENALKKALKQSAQPPKGAMVPDETPPKEEVEEVVVEKAAGTVGFHGYNLTAGLPPEFLENAKKKKEEAEAKKGDKDKDDDKSDKKAGELPDFIKEKQEERAKDKDEDDEKDKDAGKKHGYDLTADSRVPGNESKGPKDEGEEDEGWVPGHRTTQKPDEKEGAKKAGEDKHPDLGEQGETEGPDGGDSEAEKDPRHDREASSHGYDLFEVADHGYELFA